MQICLDTVREGPFAWQEQLTIPADSLGSPDLVVLGPVSVDGEIEFFDPHFRFIAKYDYRCKLACSRCLRAIDREMEGAIDILIETGGRDESPGEVRLEGDDLGRIRVFGEEIDSETFLIGELELNIPMKMLCQTDCKGLCGTCGAELNRQSSRCESTLIDPRWQALAALKAASEEEDSD